LCVITQTEGGERQKEKTTTKKHSIVEMLFILLTATWTYNHPWDSTKMWKLACDLSLCWSHWV